MAPSNSPPPVPVNFDSPEYDALQQQRPLTDSPDQLKEEVARECLDDIIHRFHLALHEQEAHHRTVVSAVDSCLATALDVIEMQYPAREDNPISVVSIDHNSWEAEKPPDPCSFDSWLRSALPETAPSSSGASDRSESWVMQQFLLKSPSIHRSPSLRSNPDTDAAAAAAAAAAGDRSTRVGYAAGTNGVPGSAKRDREGVSGSSNRSLQTNSSRRHVTKLDTRKQLTPEQEHLEEQLRQELQQRKTQEEMSRRLEQKDAEERSKLASLRKELKGKDYTYDHKGEVVILNEFDPDRTPLEALSGPVFKVAAPEEANRTVSPKRRSTLRSTSVRSAAAAAAAEAAAAASARNTLSPTEMRKERDRRLASDFKKMNPKTQPSAMETLLPAGGVTLRGAGGATKSGPLRPVQSGITREAYAKQVAKKAMQAQAEAGQHPPITPLSIPVGTPLAGGPTSTRSAKVAAASAGGAGGAAAKFLHTNSGTAAAVAAARAALHTDRPVDPLAAYGDNRYDPFAGARARPRPTAQASGGGGVGELLAAPSTPDINLSLTSAGDWGAAGNGRVYEAPPSLPHSKPTEKQLVETVGRVDRLPRERAPLPTLAPPLSPLKAGAQKPAERLQFHSILAE